VPLRIEDYALIGDCETAALVGRDGSIDWLCWPRFDSGACFSALLGTPEHGRWLIAPHGDPAEARVTRRYRPGTLILETEFETAEGAVTLIDFMPLRGQASDLVRIVAGRRGRMRMRTELVLRFEYGSIVPWITRLGDRTLRAVGGPDMVVLHTATPLHGEGLRTVGDFEVAAGQSLPFYLTYAPSHHPVPDPIDPEAVLADTERFWREWSDRCRDTGEWSEAIRRSLITLKALTYRPTGGIVAAPTTSLPELIGGPRNWDYRFCSYDPCVGQAFMPSPRPFVRPAAAIITCRPAALRAARSASSRRQRPAACARSVPRRRSSGRSSTYAHIRWRSRLRTKVPHTRAERGVSEGMGPSWARGMASQAERTVAHPFRSEGGGSTPSLASLRPAPDHAAAAFSSAPGGGLPVWT
jgi:Trehalase-like, N-terminal/Glycosyl hydrolases family 15